MPVAMALLRDVHNLCPKEVLMFILDLIKYNDNRKNKVKTVFILTLISFLMKKVLVSTLHDVWCHYCKYLAQSWWKGDAVNVRECSVADICIAALLGCFKALYAYGY